MLLFPFPIFFDHGDQYWNCNSSLKILKRGTFQLDNTAVLYHGSLVIMNGERDQYFLMEITITKPLNAVVVQQIQVTIRASDEDLANGQTPE
jgi:hypothetical protein